MSNNAPAPQPNTDLAHLRPTPSDEIDLGELLRKLISEWKIILFVTVVGAFLGIGYALTTTPIYRVDAVISTPTITQLSDTTEQNLISISRQSAFSRVTDELTKTPVQRQAFLDSALNERLQTDDDSGNYNANETFFELKNSLKIEKLVYEFNEFADDQVAPLTDMTISIETAYPIEGADLITHLIQRVNDEAISLFTADVQKAQQETLRDLNRQLETLTASAAESRQAQIQRMEEANALEIAKIQQQMQTLLENARTDRLNRITQLEEALATAQALNITDPVTWDDLRPNQRESQITNELGETTKASPLYFQGAKILSAEIERLKNRQDDRPFIGNYNQLEQKIEDLRNDPAIAALANRENDTIYIESFDSVKRQLAQTAAERTTFNAAQFLQLTQEPVAPITPIKPNKKLIVVAATVLAGFLGLFFALIRIAIREP